MKTFAFRYLGVSAVLFSGLVARAEVKTVTERNDGATATAAFKFKNVPAIAKANAASNAKFVLVDGGRDPNGGDLAKLHDGKGPTEPDQPEENFFFTQGADGGRIQVDFGNEIEIKQINTYSWHTDTRAPQVYKVYASDGKSADLQAQPKKGTDPEKAGWKLISSVDTRPKEGESGGQYGVSISETTGSLGSYRYLLFDIFKTEDADPFGNTFYSEIDVIDKNAPAANPNETAEASEPGVENFVTLNGGYQFSITTSETPDLTEWTSTALAPAVQKWYPIIAKMLPSADFEAPKKFTIKFTNAYRGVAATGGTHIECAPDWYRKNLQGEGVGSVIHELVHVVQQYGQARRKNPNATRPPGWLVEGIPDYIRWYLFEPQAHGADITARNYARAKYDGSYRISANFLNWATDKYDKDLVPKLNTVLREGTYDEEIWKKLTNHTLAELGAEWKNSLAEKLGLPAESPAPATAPAPPAAAAEQKPNPPTGTAPGN